MPMSRAQTPIFSIPMRRVEGFLADKICFRDAKARTPHPGLILENNSHNECRLQIWDKFLIKHEYKISKQNGQQFVDVTNDNNIIHRKGNIVPGAMTVSKIILPLEILFSELEISSVNIKFTGSAFYVNKDGYKDYTYPLAYIAALPSAEIVNQLSGQGGMINILRMDFGNFERIPITGDKGPEVKLARAKKRNTFNKIITEVAEGLVTYYRGLAIVNPIAKFQNSTEPVLDALNKLISPKEDASVPFSGANKV